MIRILPENIVAEDGTVDAEALAQELNKAFEQIESEAALNYEFRSIEIEIGDDLTGPFPIEVEFEFMSRPAGLFVVKVVNDDPQADPSYDGFSVDWENDDDGVVVIRHIGGLYAHSRYLVTLMAVEEP